MNAAVSFYIGDKGGLIMKKLIPIAFVALLVSCGDEDSFTHVPMVSTLDDLPECSRANDGDKAFVDDKDSIYVCSQGSWINEADVEPEEESSSGTSGKGSSSSGKGGASSSVNSSSSSTASSSSLWSSSSEEDIPGKKIFGAHYGLDYSGCDPTIAVRAINEKLEYTDTVSYTGEIASYHGEFKVCGLPEDISYAEIIVRGCKYANEDVVVEDTAYVNLDGLDSLFVSNGMTVLADRFRYLVQEGMAFADAKKQSESELQKAFFIEDQFQDMEKIDLLKASTDGEFWAAAISSYLPKLTKYFVSEEFVKEGTVNLKTDAVLDQLLKSNYANSYRYIGDIYDFANKTASEGIVEKIEMLIDTLSGRGECNSSRKGEVFKITEPLSKPYYVTCSGTQWWESTYDEKDSYALEKPCTAGTFGTGSLSGNAFYCTKSRVWENATEWNTNVPRDAFLNPDIEYGTMTDSRDGKTYKTVTLNGKTWMAQNLDFRGYTNQSLADSTLLANMNGSKGRVCYEDKTTNCDLCGSMYSWSATMNINKELTINDTDAVMALVKEQHQGICPDGWHVPSSDEYKSILPDSTGNLSEDAGKFLRSRIGWDRTYSDSLGFSALPCGRHWFAWNLSKYVSQQAGEQAYFFAHTGIKQTEVRIQPRSYDMVIFYSRPAEFDPYPDHHYSIRCVKND